MHVLAWGRTASSLSALAAVVVSSVVAVGAPGAAFVAVPAALLWGFVAFGDRRVNPASVNVGVITGVVMALTGAGAAVASVTDHRPSLLWVAVAVAAVGAVAALCHGVFAWGLRPAPAREPAETSLRAWSSKVCAWACYAMAVLWAVFGVASFFFALVLVPAALAWAIAGRAVRRGSRPAAVLVALASAALVIYWVASTLNPAEQYNDPVPAVIAAFVAAFGLALVAGMSALPTALPPSLTRRFGPR